MYRRPLYAALHELRQQPQALTVEIRSSPHTRIQAMHPKTACRTYCEHQPSTKGHLEAAVKAVHQLSHCYNASRPITDQPDPGLDSKTW